jgi:cellulose synthase/poly-beta-1,6-N-acetylglucosamine synthase-like glycosyltransferase
VPRSLANLRMKIPVRLKHVVRPARDWSVAVWHRRMSPGFARRMKRYDAAVEPEVSIVLVTYNRLPMLRECMKSLLEKTTGDDFEIVVWDNASTDGTKEYLDELAAAHPYVRVVHHPKNVGLNGVALSVELARGYYIVEMDDDVVRYPDGWLSDMLHAFKTVPRAGYLAANVVQDDLTNGNKPDPKEYTAVDYNGVVVEHQATLAACTGGWCTMTSLEVLNRVGNFPPPVSGGRICRGHPAGHRRLSRLRPGRQRLVWMSAGP